MNSGQEFIDYYSLLQVNPNCDARILELAYHYFAKMYHPDRIETANLDKFNEVMEAYRVLKDPNLRAEYDRTHANHSNESVHAFPVNGNPAIDEKTAISDAEIHEKILLTLYKRRRENANDAGIPGWYLQEFLNCSDDLFDFHVWYLKSKGYIELTEQGTLAVTIDGVDHVFSMARTNAAEKLLISQNDVPGARA